LVWPHVSECVIVPQSPQSTIIGRPESGRSVQMVGSRLFLGRVLYRVLPIAMRPWPSRSFICENLWTKYFLHVLLGFNRGESWYNPCHSLIFLTIFQWRGKRPTRVILEYHGCKFTHSWEMAVKPTCVCVSLSVYFTFAGQYTN
jgi:hypothetical protein